MHFNLKMQSEMLKHYKGEHCKFIKKDRFPHCFHVASGVALFFNLRGTVVWGGIKKEIKTFTKYLKNEYYKIMSKM